MSQESGSPIKEIKELTLSQEDYKTFQAAVATTGYDVSQTPMLKTFYGIEVNDSEDVKEGWVLVQFVNDSVPPKTMTITEFRESYGFFSTATSS